MADTDHVDHDQAEPERGPLPLPAVIHVDANQPLRFSPKEMRLLKAQTGRAFTELLVEEAPVLMAWFRLRREGWPDLRYADLEEIEIEIGGAPTADPLNGSRPITWPDSVGSGG
jgi:hypothetical protein